MFVPCQGFNNGVSTLWAEYGAGNVDRVYSGWKKALKMVVPMALFMAVGMVVFASQLIALFGVEGEALALGIKHLSFIAPFFVPVLCLYNHCRFLTGSGDVLAATTITLSSLGVRVAATYTFAYICGFWFASLYYAVPIGWVVCFISVMLRLRSGKWKTKAVIKRAAQT